jgi:hypothetical protein
MMIFVLAFAFLFLFGAGAPSALADNVPIFSDDDVSTGGGSGLEPVGYWTCHHPRTGTFSTIFHEVTLDGSNNCNHAIGSMNGHIQLERPLGTVLIVGNTFNCSSCASRTSTTSAYTMASGVTYYYRFTTTLNLPYGQLWDTWPSACSVTNEQSSCTFTGSFVWNY